MRLRDPRIRVVARAITPNLRGDHHGINRDRWRRQHGTLAGYDEWRSEWWKNRRQRRRDAIRAAVRVLGALDATHGIPGLTDDEAQRFADAIREGR